MPQPARPGVRIAQAAGLTVFLVTCALLTGLAIQLLASGIGSLQDAAVVFSTAAGAVAAGAMLIDAFDLWLRGRRMTPYSQRMFRSLVFVAVLGALATSMLGRNVVLMLVLAPAMIIYLFIARRSAGAGAAPRQNGAAGPRAAGSGASRQSAARSRQRRGGKKRR